MEKIIFHIDVNSAFLSWTAIKLLEEGYKKDIRNEIAVIGGDEKKRTGIITAASIPAKKLGIRVPEPLYKARRIYKDVLIFPGDYKLYGSMSDKFYNLLLEYSPDIERASIDECYLDYGKVKLLYGDEIEFAKMLQKRINEELKFTVNIGIGRNKLCAKMASDFEKPNKIHTLYMDEIKEKMHPLKVGDLFGVGKKTVPVLNEIGIYTIGDLANANPVRLKKYFKNQTEDMINRANGIENSIVDSEFHIPKGIGHEITLSSDEDNIVNLEKHLFELAELVSVRLRKQEQYATTVTVIIKDSFFKRKSHQRKLNNGIDTGLEIYKISKELLEEFYDSEKVRLIGIRVGDLVDNLVYQTSLFEDNERVDKNSKLDKVVDRINLKYGNKVVKKASLIRK